MYMYFFVYTTTQLLLYTFVHVHDLCTPQLNNYNTLLYQSNNSNTVSYVGWYLWNTVLTYIQLFEDIFKYLKISSNKLKISWNI